MFICHFCDHGTELLANHLNHLKIYSNLCRQFICGFNGCKFLCKKKIFLKLHLKRVHGVRMRQDLYNRMSKVLAKPNCKFICSVEICKKEIVNYQEFMKHLKGHIENDETVKCPFSTCNKRYTNISSFSSHISRHKSLSNYVTDTSKTEQNCSTSIVSSDYQELQQSIDYADNVDMLAESNFEIQNSEESNHQNEKFLELFKNNYAQLYLKLES